MKQMKKTRDQATKQTGCRRFIFLGVCAVLLLVIPAALCACNEEQKDYSLDPDYEYLFSEDDSADAKELKNVIIAQTEAYNTGDAKAYYALFDMEENDRKFNIDTYKKMRKTYDMTYQLISLDTAFIDSNNGQIRLKLLGKAENRESGELLYYYETEYVYTLVKKENQWRIMEQKKGTEYDLTGILSDEEETGTEEAFASES